MRRVNWDYVAGLAFCALALVCVTIIWVAGKLDQDKALMLFALFGGRTVYALRGLGAPSMPGAAGGGGSAPEQPSATPGQAAQRIAHVIAGGLLFGLLGVSHGRES